MRTFSNYMANSVYVDAPYSHHASIIEFNEKQQITDIISMNDNKTAPAQYPAFDIGYDNDDIVSYKISYNTGTLGRLADHREYKYNNLPNPYQSVIRSLPFFGFQWSFETEMGYSYRRSEHCAVLLRTFPRGGSYPIQEAKYVFDTDPATGMPAQRTRIAAGGTEFLESAVQYYTYIKP
ncbi:hypothetical protein MKQ68_13275 [Chitinophaga horti]|uniref:YD repeat-containing protein n=1 Tax=Chitinophaga horti TaxID=2920382 RepID=A0ABY6IY97_9BACT|nr:hypothetical protein [Chitinophaga horti]UYQ91064.1 hypothetical protein MKQ68_13275 [Chitinophaga horti]